MSEPLEMTVERAAAQSAQALLLARIFSTSVTLVFTLVGLMSCSSASKFGAVFAELGTAELPFLSAIAFRHGGTILIAILVLAAVTFFFIWARGKVAAWMAGIGLLMLTLFVPLMMFALFLPLAKIISEMSSM